MKDLLMVGDLHMTDQARDAYRFEIFDWLRRQQDKYSVAATFLAGDVTNEKDRHSATLVNKIVNGLTKLKHPIYICRGNHDYRDPNNPFFNFLNHIEGLTFVTEPKVYQGMAIIPHYREQGEFDHAVSIVSECTPATFLVHQTFDGAIAETGARLNGFTASHIELLDPPLGVYAGDVHKPQRQGIVTYVGCPYHVRFGDNYDPRVLLITERQDKNLYFDAPHKWSLRIRGPENLLNNEDLYEGDQVKLLVEMTREEVLDWKKVKASILAACKELKLEVYGVKMEVNAPKHRKKILTKSHSNEEVFEAFCNAENLASEFRETGRKLMEK